MLGGGILPNRGCQWIAAGSPGVFVLMRAHVSACEALHAQNEFACAGLSM